MSMASQQHMEKMQLRQNYRNVWHTDLTNTIKADTPCNHSLSLHIYIYEWIRPLLYHLCNSVYGVDFGFLFLCLCVQTAALRFGGEYSGS